MASVTPRASGLWSDERRMTYYDGDPDDDVEALTAEGMEYDGRSPLDRTIDRIGMGSYQWTLLSLCGFGWLADNMWMQAVAVILPRVQQHFSISDARIGIFSSSMFAGMMFGAVGWGTCSDLLGRTTAFNATLFLTAVFGILASLATSFPTLCIALFLLGSAVGGSMPTDGTLLLEHMPNGKQYLVTALSVFFSFGAVLAAVVGLIVIPSHSCPPAPAECDVSSQNMGWKYLLIVLGLITLSMFLARIAFFRLHESPRYLAHAGRPHEAIESLQLISKYNGSELSLGLEDVSIHIQPPPEDPEAAPEDGIRAPLLANVDMANNASVAPAKTSPPLVPSNQDSPTRARALLPQTSRDGLRNGSPDNEPKDYSATGKSDSPFDSSTATLDVRSPPFRASSRSSSFYSIASSATSAQSSEVEQIVTAKDVDPSTSPIASPATPRRRASSPSSPHGYGYGHEHARTTSSSSNRRYSTASLYEARSKLYWKLPRWFRKPLWAWFDRIAMVLSPEWLRTTLLVWAAWCAMSLAYTMFNVYLPKLLEGRPGSTDAPKTLTDSLWDVVIYAIGGCPGAILGAWLVDTPLGRRWSLAGSTIVTALFCMLFVLARHPWAVTASTVGISLSATTMWAVLYGWTPEIFGTRVRGTACGIASALSRIGGMIAPMLGGTLLMIDTSFPVYASIAIFLLAAVCVLLLSEDSGDSGGNGGERVFVH